MQPFIRVALLVGCALSVFGHAQAARLALVIGNAAYAEAPLKNPVNDARAIEAKLQSLGFAVHKVENLRRDQIGRTLSGFASRIKPGDDVVVFYAGHGLQVKGVNYLPAVDAQIGSEDDVPLNSLNLNALLDRLDDAKAGVKLLLLDACRNNPYARSFRSGARGLARVSDAPSGTLMHFATRPGSVAADGVGSNGLYTAHLLRWIDQPGLPVEQMFKRVAAAVRQASNGEQEPWAEGSLQGDFYFRSASAGTGTAGIPDTSRPTQVSGLDLADLQRQAERERQEAEALARMQADYDKVAGFNGAPALKLQAWDRFLAAWTWAAAPGAGGQALRRQAEAQREQARNAPSESAPAVVAGGGAGSGRDMVVKLGHAAPLSGAQAHYGKDNENGARMAVDELNARGVTIGGRSARFELVSEDDGADPKQGVAVAQKLCAARVSGVVGHLNSGTTIPAANVYNQCGLPHITPSATNPRLTQQGFKTSFRLLANDNALGAGMALYAAGSLKLKRVAVIDDRTAYGQGVAEVFKKVALARGLEVVDEQFTNDRATDFMAVLTAIKGRNPEAIFYGGMDSQAGPLLRQMDQLGMSHVRLMGGDGVCTAKLAELSGGARSLGNAVCAEGGATLDSMNGGRAWKARYDARFPGQFQVYSPYTYDAVHVLVDAMVRAGSADPKMYTPKLFDTSYRGVTGTVQFAPDGELKSPAMTLYNYRDGRKVLLN